MIDGNLCQFKLTEKQSKQAVKWEKSQNLSFSLAYNISS